MTSSILGALGTLPVMLAGTPGSQNLLLPAALVAALLVCIGITVKSARSGLGASAFLAFGCASYLFSQKLATTEGPSLCNINEVFNCDVVNTSAASELFGVPVALLGMGVYLGLAISTLLKAEATPQLFQVAFWGNVLNTLFSVYLGYKSAELGAVCVMCLTMYAAHLIMLAAAARGLALAGRSPTEVVRLGGFGTSLEKAPAVFAVLTSTTTLILAASFGIVVLVGMSTWNTASSRKPTLQPRPDPTQPAPDGSPNTSPLPPGVVTIPRGNVALAGHEPVLGNPQAPYTVLEFADFACPHCAMASKEVKQLVEMYPEVQVRFRPFPLTSQCNPAMQRDSGPERCQAAIAGACAGRQGKFWELSSLMFANQTNLGDSDLAFMAGQVGLDMAAWEQCMGDPAARAQVEADAVAGAQAGIMGTPTLFLLGAYGERWVEVQGVAGVAAVVTAHQGGQALPEPGPPAMDMH